MPASATYPWIDAYPAELDWAAPIAGGSLVDMFDHAIERYADNTCTYFLGRETTYREIGDLADSIAAGLRRHGVEPGTRLGLFLPNCPYFIAFYFGALKAGCVVVNYNPLYTVEELAVQVDDSQTEIIVTLDLKAVFDKVESLVEMGALKKVIACPFAPLLPTVKSVLFRLLKRGDRSAPRSSKAADILIPFEALAATKPEPGAASIGGETLAVLQYTGGTTGSPKGAMLSHGNLTANVEQITRWVPHLEDGGEKILAILPFFHVFAMTTIMNFGLSRGFELILMPRFDLDEAVKLIRRRQPTMLPGVPTLFNALMTYKDLKPGDLSSLRHCISGGAPLPLEIKKGFEKLAGCALVEGYGLSETSPVVTTNPFGGAVKENSIGQPLPGTVVSIRDIENPETEMPLGEYGELCVTGPQVMSGYWNRPEETADAFVGAFFRTGDAGYIDEDGFVFIVDRLKDIIICSGFNVYPRRIEEAIYEHPDVDEVTVIGIPDDYRGEAPKAFVKRHVGSTLGASELLEFLEPKLSVIEMPEEIEFRDELPKTMVGKLSKKELREPAADK